MCNWKLLLNKGIAFHNNSSAEYTTFIKSFKQMCWVKFFKPIQSLVQSMCLLLHCVQISGFWLLSSHVQNKTHSHNCTRQSGVKWFQHRLVSRLHSAKWGNKTLAAHYLNHDRIMIFPSVHSLLGFASFSTFAVLVCQCGRMEVVEL